MAIPLLALAAGAFVGGKVLGGIGAYKSGKAEAKSMAEKAAAAKLEGQMARLRGVQIGEESRDQLDRTLAAISTIRAQRGVSGDSQTAQALERSTIANSYRNEAVAVLGELNRAQAAQWAEAGYRRASKNAIPLSLLNFGSNLLGDAAGFAMAAGGGGGKGG